MSASPCLFCRHRQPSVCHEETNTCIAKVSPNLGLRSVSPISLKITSAWRPDLYRRDLVSGEDLQNPVASSWWALWGGLSHSPQLRSIWRSGWSTLGGLRPWVKHWPLTMWLAILMKVCPMRFAWRATSNPASLQAMLLHLAIETRLLNEGSEIWSSRSRYWTSRGLLSSPPPVYRKAGGIRAFEHPASSLSPSLSLAVKNPCIEILSAQCFVSSISILLQCASWMARYAPWTAQSGSRRARRDTSNTNEASFILKLHWHLCHFIIPLHFLPILVDLDQDHKYYCWPTKINYYIHVREIFHLVILLPSVEKDWYRFSTQLQYCSVAFAQSVEVCLFSLFLLVVVDLSLLASVSDNQRWDTWTNVSAKVRQVKSWMGFLTFL